MSPEELSKIRATLLQAKQSADTERKEAAAAVAKQLADAAAQPTSEGASVKGEPTSTSGAAEVAQPEVGGVGLTGGGEVIKAEEGAADGQGGDAMEIDAPEAADKEVSVGVTDEEVKAFWLSGVDAVVEVSSSFLASWWRLAPKTMIVDVLRISLRLQPAGACDSPQSTPPPPPSPNYSFLKLCLPTIHLLAPHSLER